MMRIALSSKLFDLDGHVVIDPLPVTDLGGDERRVNKVKTLDGGVAVSDRGFAWADREITVNWQTREPAYEAKIRNLLQNHSHIYCATKHGVFLATAGRYRVRGRESELRLVIRGREDT